MPAADPPASKKQPQGNHPEQNGLPSLQGRPRAYPMRSPDRARAAADAEVGFGAGLPRPARTSHGAAADRGPGLQSGDLAAATELSPARLMPAARAARLAGVLLQPAILPHPHPLPSGRERPHRRPRGSGRVLEGPGGATGMPRCSFRGGRCVAGSPTDTGTAPCPFHVLPEVGGSPRCLRRRLATGRHGRPSWKNWPVLAAAL